MKNLLIFTVLLAMLVSCKKEAVEPIATTMPTEVHFYFQTVTAAPKRVVCCLWESNKNHEKLSLIGKIDTVMSLSEGTLSIVQCKPPYIYAIMSMQVYLDTPDYLDLKISFGPDYKLLISRYGSCQVSEYELQNEYFTLYR